MTRLEAFEMFNSGPARRPRGLPGDYQRLVDFVTSGTILVKQIHYPEPPNTPEDPVYKLAFGRGHGYEHGLLKWAAWNWMRQLGEAQPRYEWWYAGGRCDVLAPHLGIIIECGNSNPVKIFQAFRFQEYRQFVLMPFDDHAVRMAWEFIPAPGAQKRFCDLELSDALDTRRSLANMTDRIYTPTRPTRSFRAERLPEKGPLRFQRDGQSPRLRTVGPAVDPSCYSQTPELLASRDPAVNINPIDPKAWPTLSCLAGWRCIDLLQGIAKQLEDAIEEP